mgnify:CR=1 FL=1
MPIAIHSYESRYIKVLLVALSLVFHLNNSALIRFWVLAYRKLFMDLIPLY